MKKIKILLPLLFAALSVFQACNKNGGSVGCTEEFRYVTLTLNNGELDNYYTVRIKTGDTLRYENAFPINEHIYVVLDDNFQKEIKNSTETFLFQGYSNGKLVVNETYKISADDCHIDLKEGRTMIDL